MCIDLHLHSYYSDGTNSPAELVRMAIESGLRGIALTDHDTIDGIDEFLAHGHRKGLEVFSGLEVSALHRDFSLHILGYGFDHQNSELRQWLHRLQEGRVKRNHQIIQKLKKMGHEIDSGELNDISRCGQTGRPHIAQLLINKGIVQSIDEAFHQFLRKDGPAFAERFAYSAAESIAMIHRAGGIAVMAHPFLLERQTKTLSLVIAELVERGLDGIEAYYPAHTPDLQKRYIAHARKYRLVLTGGSDYHGNHRSFSPLAGRKAGFCPPDDLLEPIKEQLLTNAMKNDYQKIREQH